MHSPLHNITGLDNLPNEIQHLLQEIRHKELRSQGLPLPSSSILTPTNRLPRAPTRNRQRRRQIHPPPTPRILLHLCPTLTLPIHPSPKQRKPQIPARPSQNLSLLCRDQPTRLRQMRARTANHRPRLAHPRTPRSRHRQSAHPPGRNRRVPWAQHQVQRYARGRGVRVDGPEPRTADHGEFADRVG